MNIWEFITANQSLITFILSGLGAAFIRYFEKKRDRKLFYKDIEKIIEENQKEVKPAKKSPWDK